MIVISYGVMKSGSTLAWEMAKAVLELNGYPQIPILDGLMSERDDHANIGGGWTDEQFLSLVDAARGEKIVIKTHHPPGRLASDLVRELCASGELQIHVVFRRPHDALLSMLDAGFRARRSGAPAFSEIRVLDDAIATISRQLENLRQWGSFPSLKLRYEDFAFDPMAGPSMIAEDLGLRADPTDVWERVNHRFTQKNVARPERYKTELSRDEIERVERAFPLYLDVVNGNPPVGWFARPDGTS